MVFSVTPAPKDKFEFKLEGSNKIYKVPLLQNLPMATTTLVRRSASIAMRVKKAQERGKQIELTPEEADILTKAQTSLLEQFYEGISNKLTDAQFQELMTAWNAASTITAGESSASSD